jgi:hypothetical protein
MRIIDLSVCLEAGIASDPPGMRPEITYHDHSAGRRSLRVCIPG